ncbi:MAG: hypothetical protein HY885_05160 [Deltaproteobacteria bacterium]|nr:hypothetical protein [Deltaproteobacteria bacterium]
MFSSFFFQKNNTWKRRDNRSGRKMFNRGGKILKCGKKISLRGMPGIARFGPQRKVRQPKKRDKLAFTVHLPLSLCPDHISAQNEKDRKQGELKPGYADKNQMLSHSKMK